MLPDVILSAIELGVAVETLVGQRLPAVDALKTRTVPGSVVDRQ